MRTPIQVIRDFHACVYWKANLVFALFAAALTMVGIRLTAWAFLMIIPTDSWATEILTSVTLMSKWHFAWTVGVAALGGITSFLHEVRVDPTNLRIINAIGHMFASQTAGLAMYLVALEWNWSMPMALLGCVLAGWGGNKTIQKLNDMILAKLGVDNRGSS